MRKNQWMILAAGLLTGLLALAQEKPEPKACPQPPEAGQAPAYQEIEVKNGGQLKGRVTFAGQYTPKKWKVVKDREFCGDTVIDESLAASPGGGLRWVVVSVDGVKSGKALPREVREVANQQCRYQPHATALSVCSKVMITNHDDVFHNTHAYLGGSVFEPQKPDVTPDGLLVIAYEETPSATNTAALVAFTTVFNLGLPNQDFKPKKTLREPGLITLKCDAGHTWMNGFIWVFEHPYSAVTDPDGNYSIGDLPPGEYTVTFWHEVMGVQKKKVVIKPGETAELGASYQLK